MDIGADPSEIVYEEVTTPKQAAAVAFRGSPTILVDDVDLFAQPDDPTGVACRIYQTPDGAQGPPTVDQLRAVLDLPPGDDASLVALLAVAVGVCCGLPVLISVAAGTTIGALGIRSWLLAGIGLIVLLTLGTRRYRHRACQLRHSTDRNERTADANTNRTG